MIPAIFVAEAEPILVATAAAIRRYVRAGRSERAADFMTVLTTTLMSPAAASEYPNFLAQLKECHIVNTSLHGHVLRDRT